MQPNIDGECPTPHNMRQEHVGYLFERVGTFIAWHDMTMIDRYFVISTFLEVQPKFH